MLGVHKAWKYSFLNKLKMCLLEHYMFLPLCSYLFI